MLEALSGKPPWGPELLARQQLIGNVSYLPRLYERWTEWAADISESHTTYRTLIYFRSRYPLQAWPLALLAVLDAAALHLSLCPSWAPAETRPLLRVGYITMRSIASTLSIPVDNDPRPDDPLVLTRAEFDVALERPRLLLYSIVLSQGRRNDLARFVNPRRLRDDWPQLRLLLSRPMRRACERKLGLRMPSVT